jgi:hypothetical protein
MIRQATCHRLGIGRKRVPWHRPSFNSYWASDVPEVDRFRRALQNPKPCEAVRGCTKQGVHRVGVTASSLKQDSECSGLQQQVFDFEYTQDMNALVSFECLDFGSRAEIAIQHAADPQRLARLVGELSKCGGATYYLP